MNSEGSEDSFFKNLKWLLHEKVLSHQFVRRTFRGIPKGKDINILVFLWNIHCAQCCRRKFACFRVELTKTVVSTSRKKHCIA